MTLNQPTTLELADFVRHEGAKKAGQLLGVSASAVCRKLNRAGIWMRGGSLLTVYSGWNKPKE